jgi:hypothetical protein
MYLEHFIMLVVVVVLVDKVLERIMLTRLQAATVAVELVMP